MLASLEMSESELAQRHFAAAANVCGDRICLPEREWRRLLAAAAAAEGVPLTILDVGALAVPELHAKARASAAKDGDRGVVTVDYLQLMRPVGGGSGSRTEDASEMSRGLKRLARDLGCPVLPISQFSRAVEQRADRRPVLSDLRESGQTEADADAVLFLYRDDYYELAA